MNMKKESIAVFRGLIGHSAYRCGFIVFFATSLILLGAGNCLAQQRTIPLADLVQMQDLDVQTRDLMQIAGVYADGLRDLKIAQLNLETLTSISAGTAVSQLEVKIAKINVLTAERKVAIYRAIAEKELAATQAKLEVLEQMEKSGEKGDKTEMVSPPAQNRVRIAQARAVVNILKMILDMK
jgi:hypothetical protein